MKQHQLFLPLFKASFEGSHNSVFNLGPSEEETKVGDLISEYCSRPEVLGTVC